MLAERPLDGLAAGAAGADFFMAAASALMVPISPLSARILSMVDMGLGAGLETGLEAGLEDRGAASFVVGEIRFVGIELCVGKPNRSMINPEEGLTDGFVVGEIRFVGIELCVGKPNRSMINPEEGLTDGFAEGPVAVVGAGAADRLNRLGPVGAVPPRAAFARILPGPVTERRSKSSSVYVVPVTA